MQLLTTLLITCVFVALTSAANVPDDETIQDLVRNPVVETVKWPEGTFGLPTPMSGCPNSHFVWKEGIRYHDTEDSDPNNFWSYPIHLAGRYGKNNTEQHFCIKKNYKEDSDSTYFPFGRYCVFKYGDCPLGLTPGWVKWDDEDSDNSNFVSGYVPDGRYTHDTFIEFCCATSGDPGNPIYLPVEDNFYLFKFAGTECQKVHGMRVSSEYFRWDTEDISNADGDGGAHPYQGKTGPDNILLEYCYYEPM